MKILLYYFVSKDKFIALKLFFIFFLSFAGVFLCKNSYGDDYFNQVLDNEYEKLNLNPISFKIEIFDEMEIDDNGMSNLTGSGKIRAGYLFQTDGKQVRFDNDTYDPLGLTNERISKISKQTHKTESDMAFLNYLEEHCLNKPTSRNVMVRDRNGNTKAVDICYSTNKTSYVLIICEPWDTFSIGLGESGTYAVNKKTKPRRRMTSMIFSPCFAPLDISKMAMKCASNVVKRNIDANTIVYTFDITLPGDSQGQYEFHILPNKDNAISKSIYKRLASDGKIIEKTTRSVEEWKQSENNLWLPVKFVYQHEFTGKRPLKTRVERTFKDILFGDIDKTMFDTAQIPEFTHDFDDTQNRLTKTYSSWELPKTSLFCNIFRIFCMTLGIALTGFIIYKKWGKFS